MKTVVISLKKSVERRTASQQYLNQYDIKFEFLDAVDGRVGKHSLLERYNEKEFLLNYGRKAVPGEVGCYSSHLLAWQYCVNVNEPIIIFEDDFILSENFLSAIATTEKLIDRYGFIRLEPTKKKPQVLIKKEGDFSLIKFLKVPQCLTCYAISPDVAKALLLKSEEITCPVDVFVRNVAMHKQSIYGLEPYFCYPGGVFCSEIGKRKREQSKTIQQRACILLRKIKNMTRNFIEHVRQFIG
jgi:glycosyl transferase family 25